MLRFSGAGVSDVGLVRPENEDAAFVGPYVCVVADGVGGAAAGEVASATATYAVAATALALFGQDPERVLHAAAEAARSNVQRGVQADLDRLGMATTLTALVCDGQRVALGHVGDSRAYLLQRGMLTQVSRDHTYVQRLVENGEMDAERARTHPWRNVVLRSVDGDPEHQGIDVVPLEVGAGDRFLLCSDGLTDLVTDEVLGTVLRDLLDPDDAVSRLVEAALAAGGKDNVTCVVVDLVDGPPVVGDGQLLGAVREIANIVDPASVRVR